MISHRRRYLTAANRGSVHITPDGCEDGGFTLKAHQKFSVDTTPEKFENEGFTLKTHQLFC